MNLGSLREAYHRARNYISKVCSQWAPYEPMAGGAERLDAEYKSNKWDYLQQPDEAPRHGVVGVYCQIYAGSGAILEVGCGDGTGFSRLNPGAYSHYTGIDISAEAIRRAQAFAGARAEFLCAAAEEFTASRRYETIILNEVMEYFDDPRRVAAELCATTHASTLIVSMFSGLDTARSRTIWRLMEDDYALLTRSSVSTSKGLVWHVKVFAVGRR